MTPAQRFALALIAGCALSLTLDGCIIASRQPYYAQPMVMVAPPPPQLEVIGVVPAAGYVWIDGYWNWTGSRHVWIGGRWDAPRPGHMWVAHRWVRQGAGWRMAPGHWARR